MYSTWQLWLAYGIAIGLSTLCVIAGSIDLLRAGKSYNSTFSTVMRTTRGAQLSVEVDLLDTDGRSPLPTYIKGATFTLKSAELKRKAHTPVNPVDDQSDDDFRIMEIPDLRPAGG